MIKYKITSIILIIFLVASGINFFFGPVESVRADFGDIIKTIEVPWDWPYGLAWDGEYLWNVDAHGNVHKINSFNGEVVTSFKLSGLDITSGLTWDGHCLWVISGNNVYKLNPLDGSILHKIKVPITEGAGLTWDGEYLWISVCRGEVHSLYKIETQYGNILEQVDSKSSLHYPQGLAWEGGYLWNIVWIAGNEKTEIRKINPLDGDIIKKILFNDFMMLFGLTFDGKNLWASHGGPRKIYKIDIGNVIINDFNSPGSFPTGLAWDGTNLINADMITGQIYELNPSNGEKIRSYSSPGENPMPTGITYGNNYLWIADSSDKKIYRYGTGYSIKISGNPAGLAWGDGYLWNVDSKNNKIYKIVPDKTGGFIHKTFNLPEQINTPRGLTYKDNYLCLADQSTEKIYKLKIVEKKLRHYLEIEKTYETPGNGAWGLTSVGNKLFHSDKNAGKIYKMDINCGKKNIAKTKNFTSDRFFRIDNFIELANNFLKHFPLIDKLVRKFIKNKLL